MPERPEHTWFLLSRHIGGEASKEESEQLMEELQKNPALQQQYELLSQLWQVPGPPKPDDGNPDKISRILQLSELEQVMGAVEEEKVEMAKVVSFRKKLLKYAAVIVSLSLAGYLIFYFTKNNHNPGDGQIIAKNGSRTRAILPDGSTVWLNAGSTISYEPGFTGKLREVTLQGEAYFDVIKQPNRPFIVHAGSIDIRVLGTAFNVKSYPDDKTVETTLIRGLVQINRKNQSQAIYLQPHQKIVLPAYQETVVSPNIENSNSTTIDKHAFAIAAGVSVIDSNLRDDELIETAWIFNRLEFRGDNFSELAKKLERWYNINIHFTDDEAKQLQFNGSLENETVQQALVALKTAVPFEFTINDNEIFIGSQKETLP